MQRCGIGLEELAAYHDEIGDVAASARIEDHLRAGCTACKRHLAWLKSMVHGIRNVPAIADPSFSLEPARALFRDRWRPQQSPSGMARLVFDSRAAPALANVRSVRPAAFQQLYATDEHDVDLWCEPQPDGTWYLIGQALPRDGTTISQAARAELTGETAEPTAATFDGNEFHFRSVPSGSYRLDIHLGPADVAISPIRLEK
jgi:hypothetical protein